MGLLQMFRTKPATLVRVTFRDIAEPPPRTYGRGYVYTWPHRSAPEIGLRVLVPGMDGPAWAVVIGVNDADREERRQELKSVIRPATAQEVAKGQAHHERDANAWLDMMRAAGLPTKGRARNKLPKGYPEVPPAEGTAAPEVAGRYGSAWWRAFKSARDDEERKRFESLARRWYAIRDRGH